MAAQMKLLGVDVVFSSLAPETAAKVYIQRELRGITIVSSLPGYVPDRLIGRRVAPISERPIDLIYRGRELAPHLGRLAQEKRQLRNLGGRLAQLFGLRADLDATEGGRIYGAAWDDFLASAKAMLAVEGGVSIFDFDGSIEETVSRYLAENQDAGFVEIHSRLLRNVDGRIVHRTITPRCFEAIAMKTALILQPGEYRGVLQPWRHYIPLEPAGANLEEVGYLLRDDQYLQKMVDRTYSEIVASGAYSFERYVSAIDRAFDHAAGRYLTTVWHRAANKLPAYLCHIQEKVDWARIALVSRFARVKKGALELVAVQRRRLAPHVRRLRLTFGASKPRG
jgi:hypothetical protein